MLPLWANWLVTKFGLNSLKRYLWPVLYIPKYNFKELKSLPKQTISTLHSALILKNMKLQMFSVNILKTVYKIKQYLPPVFTHLHEAWELKKFTCKNMHLSFEVNLKPGTLC